MPHGLPKQAIEKICGILAQHPEVHAAILYGSRAKGSHRPGSDIDLTLIGEKLTLTSLNRIDAEMDNLLLPWIIDLSIHSHIENAALLEHIERTGKILYAKN